MMNIVLRLILGLAGLAPHAPPELPLLLLLEPPKLSTGRLLLLELPRVPHFFGAGRDADVLPRLPQLTALTRENGRPDPSIRLPPNGLNRQPLLPHFANPIPSRIPARSHYPYLCGTWPKKKISRQPSCERIS